MMRYTIAAIAVLAFLSVPWYVIERHTTFLSRAATNAPVTKGGLSYVHASDADVVITSPKANADITNTIIITGYARGSWFFESSFPIEVRNKQGMVIGTGHATTESNPVTENLVPFTAEVDLKALYNGPATVTLKKDNPSGEMSRDASVSFTVNIR